VLTYEHNRQLSMIPPPCSYTFTPLGDSDQPYALRLPSNAYCNAMATMDIPSCSADFTLQPLHPYTEMALPFVEDGYIFDEDTSRFGTIQAPLASVNISWSHTHSHVLGHSRGCLD
jgi:hypothetical protein